MPGPIFMAGEEGFEPPNAGTKTQCLTAWPLPIVSVGCGYTKPLVNIAAYAASTQGLYKIYPYTPSVIGRLLCCPAANFLATLPLSVDRPFPRRRAW